MSSPPCGYCTRGVRRGRCKRFFGAPVRGRLSKKPASHFLKIPQCLTNPHCFAATDFCAAIVNSQAVETACGSDEKNSGRHPREEQGDESAHCIERLDNFAACR